MLRDGSLRSVAFAGVVNVKCRPLLSDSTYAGRVAESGRKASWQVNSECCG